MATAQTTWQEAIRTGIHSPNALLEALNLHVNDVPGIMDAHETFKIRVPRRYLQRIEKGNPQDPLLLELLPRGAETQTHDHYVKDPLQETASNPLPGLLHKYSSRVLLTLTQACAIHCRYCFRRHFPYAENSPASVDWGSIQGYITARPEITEIILSGGDPLMLTDALLSRWLDRFSSLKQIKLLRIHTRVPIILPERITEEFLKRLSDFPMPVTIVLHVNHAKGLDDELTQDALKRISGAGIQLLNQSVILRGVNDDLDTLIQLSYSLYKHRVLPYYVHLLDKVDGAQHFDIEEEQAVELIKQLRAELPGYLVPRLVRETPGAPSKSLVL